MSYIAYLCYIQSNKNKHMYMQSMYLFLSKSTYILNFALICNIYHNAYDIILSKMYYKQNLSYKIYCIDV
jgi:hypothetical protein